MIEFKPIPPISGVGYTALSIREPGEWFNEPTYSAFIGGCGIGTTNTLEEAKQKLLDCAIIYCNRQITEAEKVIAHYQKQVKKLSKRGLTAKPS